MFLCGVFLSPIVLAEGISVNTTLVDLGTVNGQVINNEVKIERSLTNPILISLVQHDFKQSITALSINYADLLKVSNKELTIRLSTLLDNGGGLRSQVVLSEWVDGHQIPIVATQHGSRVVIQVPKDFDTLELRATKPIETYVPKGYRGSFNYKLEVEALSK